MSTTNFISYYEEKNLADRYFTHRPKYPPQVADAIISYMRTLQTADARQRKFGRMIDVGCGSGQPTQLFADHFDSILGVDISAEQLDVARKRNKADHITFQQVDDNIIPANDASVDLVTCATAAHWFDIEQLVGECERVLKRNGCATFFIYFAESMKLDGKTPSHNQSELDLRFQDMIWQFVVDFEGHPRNQLWAKKYEPIFQQIPNDTKQWIPDIEFNVKWTLLDWRKYWTTKGDYVQYLVEKKPAIDPLNVFIEKLKKFLDVETKQEEDVHLNIRWVVPTIIFNKK